MTESAAQPVTESAARPRTRASSLSEWLRNRSDEQLAELLGRRPDLALPAPADLATLAARVGVRTSVQRAVDGLDVSRLRVLEALVLAESSSEPVSAGAAATLLPGVDVRPAIDELRLLGLVWGDDDRLHFVAHVVDAVGRYPAGL
ncbi:MAG TPA: hypothetical protein VEK09_03495, partial [Jatrophihabitantaceae bacterium]|nr:hypothetical protein [Jatrophihabitantaceae bacterium]